MRTVTAIVGIKSLVMVAAPCLISRKLECFPCLILKHVACVSILRSIACTFRHVNVTSVVFHC